MSEAPINLAQLRDQTGFGDHQITITRDELLALIDTAESAHAYVRAAFVQPAALPEAALLLESLGRFSTDHEEN